MTRGKVIFAALLVLAAVFIVVVAGKRVGAAGPSSLSRDGAGYLAAREYLRRRGSAVATLDRPITDAIPGQALVLSFPWEIPPGPGEIEALRGKVSVGGEAVIAYSGERLDASEERVAAALGVHFESVRGDLPLDPAGWYRSRSAEWILTPEPGLGPQAPPLTVRAPRSIPVASPAAQVLYRAKGRPAVFALPLQRGRIFVVPADALSNGRLSAPGNAALLESLRMALPDGIAFDEYHHGLVAARAPGEAARATAFDVLLAQLALLYGLCVAALARRFGPAWREAPAVAGSTASFLIGLAALHRRLGHSSAAARLLVRRAEEWNPRIAIPRSLRAAADTAEGPLLELAVAIAQRQNPRRTE